MTEEYTEQTGWMVGRMLSCEHDRYVVVGVYTSCVKARKALTSIDHFMLPFIFDEPIDEAFIRSKFPCQHIEGVPETSYR